MGDWSALPRDVIACFPKRLTSLKDYNAFRAVCTSWRWAATKENFTTSQQVPWHVAFCVHHDFEQTWRFHSLEKNKNFNLLPLCSSVRLESLGDKALIVASGPSFSVKISGDTAGYFTADCSHLFQHGLCHGYLSYAK
ncbi:hypothetical protein L484_009181 [Morus notabilis]|uniref:F-box domain-containing protein n=1 Tax=Morus notabilis TaxID=981085 RepID=W9RHX8_9ROSA|nr:hypothetical protein L484_009181 [Morus notabilis]